MVRFGGTHPKQSKQMSRVQPTATNGGSGGAEREFVLLLVCSKRWPNAPTGVTFMGRSVQD